MSIFSQEHIHMVQSVSNTQTSWYAEQQTAHQIAAQKKAQQPQQHDTVQLSQKAQKAAADPDHDGD